MKNNSENGKEKTKIVAIATLMLIVLLGLANLVFSLSFVLDPQINSGETVYTANDLVCSWQASADATQTNVTWYKQDVSQFTFTVAGNTSTLDMENTSKNQEWICEVWLFNATDTIIKNVSVNISNTPQTVPVIYNSTKDGLIANEYPLMEDINYTFFVNSTDDDGDALTFDVDPDGDGLCTLISASTGEISCRATHTIITGSSSDAPESGIFKNVTPEARASNPGISVFDENRSFYLVPVNDQATFTQSINDVSLPADTPWQLFVNGSDEELDYNIQFTVSSDLDGAFPGLLIIENVNSTIGNLTFNTSDNSPSNLHVGNWTVYLNLTDNSSSNATRPPAQLNFTLEITPTNHPPLITTNFNNTLGVQGENFSSFIYANDSDVGDNLTFAFVNPSESNETCNEILPWNITTTNISYINATGEINLTLNNSHVVCRYVNLTVTDQVGGLSSVLVFFNITNVNDIPEIYEIGSEGNISNQNTTLFVSYSYQVNASDIDSETYDYLSTGTLTYYINDSSIFDINSSTGVITGYPTDSSDVGNYTYNITAGDGEYNVSTIMNITILSNTPPIINLSTNNFETPQNQTILINFTSLDTDNDSMTIAFSSLTGFNNSYYSIIKVANNYSNNQNLATWTLNLSRDNDLEANDLVGNHSLQINVSDEFNASSNESSVGVLEFNITNVNDAPFFDTNRDNSSDLVSFGVVVINIKHVQIINVTDFDLFIPSANESLNFSYSEASVNMTEVNFTKIGDSQAYLSFTPVELGNMSIILNVTDSNGSSNAQNVSFIVKPNSSDPIVHEIKPYLNSSSNETVFDFGNATLFSSNTVNVSVNENSTIIFDAIVENDSTIPDNNLTFNWYLDGVLNNSISAVNPGVNSNFSVYFDFFSNGTKNVTLEAVDSRFSSTNWTWKVNISDVNRPPVLVNALDNITVNLSTTFINYLSYRSAKQRFYDPDDDLNGDGNRSSDFGENTSLVYKIIGGDDCSFITLSITGDDFSIVPTATGLCEIQILANDTYNQSVTSNTVRITVVGADPNSGDETPSSSSGGSSVRTQIVTVPFEEEVDVPSPIELLAPETVETYVNKTIRIPITVRNTWTEVVNGVSLSGVTINASFVGEDDVNITFSDTYFPSIPVGGEYKSIVTLSNYRKEGPFELKVTGVVQEPYFEDSVSILINSLEQTSEGDEIRTKITFAEDMLSENPECKELNDLLTRAKKSLGKNDYKESINLVNAVINGCKYLITKTESARTESPSIIQESLDFVNEHANDIVLGAVFLTLITLIVYIIAGVRRMIQNRT